MPEYMRDVHRNTAETNPADYGIQLSRGFRALKVWLSMSTFGMAAFRAAVRRTAARNGCQAEVLIDNQPRARGNRR